MRLADLRQNDIRILAFVAALLLIVSAGCGKISGGASSSDTPATKTIEKTVEKGPVTMSVRLSPAEPRLSDTLSLEIIIKAAADVEVQAPVFGQAIGDFLVRDYTEKPAQVEDSNRVRRFHYTLEPTYAGKHLIRAIAIEFRDRRLGSETKGEPVALESEPLEVTVTSEFGDKTPSLTDLIPMQAPLPLSPRPIWTWVISAISVLAAVAASIVWWRYRKRKHLIAIIARSPEEIASDELKALMAENLHGKGEFQEFYVRLTGMVRRYIEATTSIRAPEETTEEFLRDMRARQIFPPERSLQLAQFLEAADLVKYAAQQPSQHQIEEAITRAQEFVRAPSAFSSKLAGADTTI
ncbi:MAG: hypothetical protein V1899_09140 [Planctomycetota bacterium]